MDEFLEKAGFTLLRDEYVLIDNAFYLYGRPDYERPGRGIEERKTAQEITDNMDLSLPVLVIDHEPRELQNWLMPVWMRICVVILMMDSYFREISRLNSYGRMRAGI